MKEISWTVDMLKRFKKAYEEASKEEKMSFMFDYNEFDLGYAKYLIEFLEIKFKVSQNGNHK